MRVSKLFTFSHFSTRLLNTEKIRISYLLLSRQLFINSANMCKAQPSDKKDTEELDEELQAREEYIKQQQNKSKLYRADYNRQNDKMPFEKPAWEYHETLRYRRKMYGKYGEVTKINPSILWPSYEEMDFMKEYESVAQPYSFHELLEKAKEKTRLAEARKEAEKAAVLAKVSNVKREILEFHKRVRQKNEEAKKVAERKNKMIEEVRLQLGHEISVEDKKFKEMLEKQEKKYKKELKAAKAEEKSKKKELFQGELKNKEVETTSSEEEEKQ